MNKKIIVFTLIAVLLCASFVIAKDVKWFDKEKPTEKLSLREKDKLIEQQYYSWVSEAYWQEGNCYYYDLAFRNETGVVWQDQRRELLCGKTLSSAEIETLQLDQISWTMKQLSTPEVIPTRTFVKSKKGEDLRTGEVLTD